jgi:hypothetical protein
LSTTSPRLLDSVCAHGRRVVEGPDGESEVDADPLAGRQVHAFACRRPEAGGLDGDAVRARPQRGEVEEARGAGGDGHRNVRGQLRGRHPALRDGRSRIVTDLPRELGPADLGGAGPRPGPEAGQGEEQDQEVRGVLPAGLPSLHAIQSRGPLPPE